MCPEGQGDIRRQLQLRPTPTQNILNAMPCRVTVNSNNPFEIALAYSTYRVAFGSHRNSITSSVVSPLFQSALYT